MIKRESSKPCSPARACESGNSHGESLVYEYMLGHRFPTTREVREACGLSSRMTLYHLRRNKCFKRDDGRWAFFDDWNNPIDACYVDLRAILRDGKEHRVKDVRHKLRGYFPTVLTFAARMYGVKVVRRMKGVNPGTFWKEKRR